MAVMVVRAAAGRAGDGGRRGVGGVSGARVVVNSGSSVEADLEVPDYDDGSLAARTATAALRVRGGLRGPNRT